MYIPKHYLEEDWEQAQYLIEHYPLATVVTSFGEEGIIANHFPLLYKEDKETGKKYLIAHIAKKNHQIPSLQQNDDILVIFQSHNSYISPSYYPTKAETHKFVPTWDFASVHIKGKSRLIDDFDFVRDQLNALTTQQEKGRAEPWKVSEAPEPYLKAMQKAIIGLEIEIDSFSCKYKFEQAMPRKEIDGVIKGLAEDKLPEVSELTKTANERAELKKSKATN
ncbi:negative transcriptional regulator [Scheffersomyces amazonensis]|uniref:negative transcriptional regulator n=1 Tax=Scheffersomyces amazonensis TaxID=1078765 RepID=UPI00315C5385